MNAVHIRRAATVALVGALGLALVAAAWAQDKPERAGGGGRGGAGPSSAPALATPGSVRMHVVVWEVMLSTDKVADFDVDALIEKAPTPAACEALLAERGATRAMYRLDQTISGAGADVDVSSDLPFVSGRGPAGALHSRQNCSLKLACRPMAPGEARIVDHMEIRLGLSTMDEGDNDAASDSPEMIFRRESIAWVGSLKGTPGVVASVTADEGRDGAVAYVAWLKLTETP